MTFDPTLRDAYGAGVGAWADDATVLYRPLARALVAALPIDLSDRYALDVGAGTGVASELLVSAGARVVAVDLAHAMLRFEQAKRPVSVAGDVLALPLCGGAVDVSIAAFVLNHVLDPAAALQELRRVTTPRGWVAANAFSVRDRFPVKEQIDAVVAEYGWSAPDWYRTLQQQAMPKVGTAEAMIAAATAAGLDEVDVSDRNVDVGTFQPSQLARYRLGMPHVAEFLQQLDPEVRREVFEEATRVVQSTAPAGSAVAPAVVTLVARMPG